MDHSKCIVQNYQRTRERIEKACLDYGRKIEDITIVAVSKFHPVEQIEPVAAVGQMDFGENYMQEAMEKIAIVGLNFPDIRWHMIGHIQSRKASQAAGNFVLIHTLDSIKLAAALERKLAEIEREQAVLIEVNIGAEPQKSGVMIENLPFLVEYVLKNCPRLILQGLMCLPPVFNAGDAARSYFADLRKYRDNLEREFDISLPQLSMGMSGDFVGAIAEGSTIVRIGTDIFGPRPVKNNHM